VHLEVLVAFVVVVVHDFACSFDFDNLEVDGYEVVSDEGARTQLEEVALVFAAGGRFKDHAGQDN
jgi:hypothetical protein